MNTGLTHEGLSTFTPDDKEFLDANGISALPYPETLSHQPAETAASLGSMSLKDEAVFSLDKLNDPTMAWYLTATRTGNGNDDSDTDET